MSIPNINPSPEALLAGIVAIADAIGPNCHAKMSNAIVSAQRRAMLTQANCLGVRDQFALAALPAIMSAAMDNGARRKGGGAITEAWIAQYSYEIADAMLAARSAA